MESPLEEFPGRLYMKHDDVILCMTTEFEEIMGPFLIGIIDGITKIEDKFDTSFESLQELHLSKHKTLTHELLTRELHAHSDNK